MAKARTKRCTECLKRFTYKSVSEHAWFPFCSERCKTIDLARWFTNRYGFVEDLAQGNDMKVGGIEAIQDSDPPD